MTTEKTYSPIFYFTNSTGAKYSGEYKIEGDYFSIIRTSDVEKEEFRYEPEEVEHNFNRGIWRRYS